ncbi:MAG: hypothetical protein AB7G75_17090 [Candidatus Binatia bacterium]
MDLAIHQRQLLGLLKGTQQITESADPYVQSVARSAHLPIVQEVIQWWREYGLEQTCPLTTTLLKRRGLFEEAVRTMGRTHLPSPFIEQLGMVFLEMLSRETDSLTASLAQFERALIQVKRGDNATYTIAWEYEPYAVLSQLLGSNGFDDSAIRGSYQTVVSHAFPELFRVVAL